MGHGNYSEQKEANPLDRILNYVFTKNPELKTDGYFQTLVEKAKNDIAAKNKKVKQNKVDCDCDTNYGCRD